MTLEERVAKLENRNQKVEGNKAWETSWTRRGAIMVATYITVAFYLRFVLHISPWINAFVPVIGFMFSTLTITKLKQHWLARRLRR